MICKVITIVWTSADIIKILLTLIDIVRVHNLKTEKTILVCDRVVFSVS